MEEPPVYAKEDVIECLAEVTAVALQGVLVEKCMTIARSAWVRNNVNQRLKLDNYVSRQFTGHVRHISAQIGDGRQHELAACSPSECSRITLCRLLRRNGGVVPQCHTARSRANRVAVDEPRLVEFRMVADFGEINRLPTTSVPQ